MEIIKAIDKFLAKHEIHEVKIQGEVISKIGDYEIFKSEQYFFWSYLDCKFKLDKEEKFYHIYLKKDDVLLYACSFEVFCKQELENERFLETIKEYADLRFSEEKFNNHIENLKIEREKNEKIRKENYIKNKFTDYLFEKEKINNYVKNILADCFILGESMLDLIKFLEKEDFGFEIKYSELDFRFKGNCKKISVNSWQAKVRTKTIHKTVDKACHIYKLLQDFLKLNSEKILVNKTIEEIDFKVV